MIAFRLMHVVVIILVTKLAGIIMTRRKVNGNKSSTNGESLGTELGSFRLMWIMRQLKLIFSLIKNQIREKIVVAVIARACVCVCMFISFHRKVFSWLNNTINVILELSLAVLCCGNISVSRISASPRQRQS